MKYFSLFTTILFCFFYNAFLFAQQTTVSTIDLDAPLSLDGLLVTPDGSLYGTEGYDGHRIFKIHSDGSTEVVVSNLNGPIDMDYDSSGNIYVSTFNNAGLYKFDPAAPNSIQYFASVTTGPSGVVANRETGDIYVSHYGFGIPGNGNSIYKVDESGNSSVFVQGNGLNVPVSLAIDEEGNLYAPNISNAKLFKITPNGNISLLAALPTSSIHPFNIGHIAYANGSLFVTGNDSQPLVFKVELDGTYEIIAGDGNIGNQDGPANQAQFNGPNGIAASITGDTLFISELNNLGALRMVIFSTATSSNNLTSKTTDSVLFQNFPNPFQQKTTLSFELEKTEHVKLSIYNLDGQWITTILNALKNPGKHTIDWSPKNLQSGTYIFRMETSNNVFEKKLVYLKIK